MDELKLFYEKHRRGLFYSVAFLMPFLATLMLFAMRHIYPFGEVTFLKKDMYQQYLPFFYEYYRKLKSGESLFYSWNAGLGANFLAVIAYYLASPLNFLIVLFPEKNILEFMSYGVVIKTGLMGLTCSMFLRYHFKRHDPAMAFFSLAYAMSAFMAAYNWNVEWMDVLFITPLVLLGLERLVEGKSAAIYYLSLSYAIFTNYYLSIMLCIFVTLYFINLQVIKGFKTNNLLRFLLFSILGGSTGAVYILPEFFALKFTTFTNIKAPKELTFYLNPLELFTRHLFGAVPETGLGHYPNIYCGIVIIFFTFIYALENRIPLKERICHLSLILIFLLSFDINILNFIWHGLNYPDSLPARQGYLYIVLLMMLSYEAFLYLRDMEKNRFYIAIAISYVLIALCTFLSPEETLDSLAKIITIISAVLIVIIFLLYRTAPDKYFFPGNGQELTFRYALLFLFAAEIVLNMYFTNNRTVKRPDYFSKYDDYIALNREKDSLDLENDSPLNRADEVNRNVRNDSMTIGYSSLSYFSSTTNGLLIKYLNKYGFMNSRVFYLSDGATALTSMLLSEKYIFVPGNAICTSEDIATALHFSNGAALYGFNDTIPNGYVLRLNDETEKKLFLPSSDSEQIIDGELYLPNSDSDPIEAQNTLVHDLGISGTAFMRYGSYDSGNILKNDTSISVKFTDDCHLYAYNASKTNGELKVTLTDSTPEGKMTANKYRYIYDLGYHAKGTIATFTSEEGGEDFNFEFYRLNNSVISNTADSINNAEHLYHIVKKDLSLSGEIDMKKPGRLVLSVPYEPGWSLYVDGEKQDMELFDGLFISADLKEGHHYVKIEFFPKGFTSGVLISLISFFTAMLLLKYGSILRKRKLKQQPY